MALDLDHPIHQFLLRISEARGEPWPPDPYLGGLRRVEFLIAMADSLNAQLDSRLDDLDTARQRVESLQSECRELEERAHVAINSAHCLAVETAAHAGESPWPSVMRPADIDAPNAYSRKRTK